MSVTLILLPLAIATLALIVWSSARIVSRLRRKHQLSLRSIFCLVAALLLVDLFICLYFLAAAGLSHSTHAQRIAPWQCLLSFLIVVIAPMVVLLHVRYFKMPSPAGPEVSTPRRARAISVGSVLLLAIAIVLSAARSGAWPPLHYAMRNGHSALTEVLLRLHPDLNATGPYGWTPLTLSVHREDHRMIGELVKRGADVNVNGGAPLKRAVLFGKAGAARLLLESGADPDGGEHGQTPLMIASERGHLGLVRLLLESDADVERRDSRSQTALSLANKNEHHEVVRLLKDSGARATSGTP